jgi:hypothetical protein
MIVAVFGKISKWSLSSATSKLTLKFINNFYQVLYIYIHTKQKAITRFITSLEYPVFSGIRYNQITFTLLYFYHTFVSVNCG